MKVLKWIIIGLGTLFLLWIFGILFKILGVLISLFGAVIGSLTALFFSRAFWVVAITGLVVFLILRNRTGRRCRRSRHQAPPSSEPTSGTSYSRKVGDLDRRLDRLNDMLSRHT